MSAEDEFDPIEAVLDSKCPSCGNPPVYKYTVSAKTGVEWHRFSCPTQSLGGGGWTKEEAARKWLLMLEHWNK